MSRSNIVPDLVQKLEEEICQAEGAELAPTEELCEKLDVSSKTLIKALNVLRDKGILSYHQGQRIRIAGREEQRTISPTVSRVCEMLRRRIDGALLAAGDVVPKVSHLAEEFDVSVNTVRAALVVLEEEGMIHRSGRAWVVGPGRASSVAVVRTPPRVVFLVVNGQNGWGGLRSADRTARFCRAFEQEAEKARVLIRPILVNPSSDSPATPAGLDRARQFASELGDRYAGSLLTLDKRDVDNLGRWVEGLGAAGGPVVWLDRHGVAEPLAAHPLLVRCHFSESAVDETAAEYLSAMGHRVVGFARQGNGEWVRVRGERLAELGALQPNAYEVITHPSEEDINGVNDSQEKGQYAVGYLKRLRANLAELNRLIVSGPPETRSILESLYQHYPATLRDIDEEAPTFKVRSLITLAYAGANNPHPDIFATLSLLPYLTDERITVLVVPNDAVACVYHRWLEAAGIAVPERISFLSFDNYDATHLLPITTIDFGFGFLGYWALHALLRDLPIGGVMDAEGNIRARPFIVDRGSVATVEAREPQLA